MAKQRKKRRISEAPTSDCLLLCDDVLVSQGKNKHSLMGVIGAIGVTSFPSILGGYVAYARFSNVYAGQKINLKFTSAATDEVLFEGVAEFPGAHDPLGVYTLVVPIRPFTIKQPGRYIFGAYHDGIPIAASPVEIKGPPPEENP